MGVEELLRFLDQFLRENGDDSLHEVIGEIDLNVKLARLHQCLEKGYLIILDNFETLLEERKIADKGVETFLQAFLSGDHSSKILITSRYGFLFRDEKGGGSFRTVDLKELRMQAAVQLLEKLEIEDYRMRREIHKKIGGNPQFLEFFVNLAKTRSIGALLEDITPVREKVGDW